MTEQLRIADIARLRGCTPAQIGTWRSQSAPGKRLADNPFPGPDGQDGRSPLWNADRADELAAWEPTARAIAAAEAPAEPPRPQHPQIGQQVFDQEADSVLEWNGTDWIQVDPAQDAAQVPAEAPTVDDAAAAREQQRPRRHY